jgi:ATP-binding cassette, subfamily C, bacterial CydC
LASYDLALPKSLKFRAGLIVAIIEGLSAIALAATSAYLISRASEMPPVMYLMVAIVGVRAFALFRAGSRYFQRILLHDSVFERLSKLRPVLFQKVAALTPGYGGANRAESLRVLTDDVDELENLGLRIVAPIATAAASVVFVAGVVWWSFPKAGLAIGVLIVALLFLVGILSHAFGAKGQKAKSESAPELHGRILTYLENADLYNSLGWAEAKKAEISALGKRQLRFDASVVRSLGLATGLLSLGAVLVATIGGFLASMDIPELASGNVLAVAILAPLAAFDVFQGVQSATTAITKFRISNGRIQHLIETEPGAEYLVADGELELAKVRSVRFRNLVVLRAGNSVVDNFNLDLKSGDLVALTGRSGAGKSTLAAVLTGLLSESAGQFLINDIAADLYSLEQRRSKLLLISQEPHLFAGTLRQNLVISGQESQDALIASLVSVGLWQRFADVGGLDALLFQDSKNISGGEAARLAIARGLLADSDLLVLDEPTSGLDSENAASLMQLLGTLSKSGKIIVVITHDPVIAAMTGRQIHLGD